MKLNSRQIEMLKTARELLADNFEAHRYDHMYLCHQVFMADKGITEIPCCEFHEELQQCSPDAQQLVGAITRAIDGRSTMESYLAAVSRVDRDQVYYGFSYLARMAWLDRMIETGEVA